MPAQAYELMALGARYWFAFLAVIIVWRSFLWLRKDGRARRRRLKQLPDAGLVGELVVLAGSDALPPGTVIPLPREGTFGSLRSCDVSVPCPGVAGRHGDFRFVDGVGLILAPAPGQTLMVDGQELDIRHREGTMHHGSRLAVGDAVLRMRLFMGLETTRTAAFQPDMPEENEPALPGYVNTGWVAAGGKEPPEGYPPGWDDDTQPHRQRLRAFMDTGPYLPNSGPYAPPYDGEYPADGEEEPYPEEVPYTAQNEPYPGQEWETEEQSAPPPKRRLFHRGRRQG